ncbi:MAG TPA: MoxR family ATPase [Bdellovibrionota bacterium]|nr:MoxR family ATPase [Bdellovibrionota bacterium]
MNDCLPIISGLFENIRKVIIGKDEQIKQLLCCWLAGGHILIEDAPGTGKTILARAVSKSAKVAFRRIQFTPDLLPTDIVGSAIYNQQKGSFEFMRGPVFTTILLADEINRATPRTQSALLEAMAEGQVTAEGMTWPLPQLFFVIATQNPIEQHGTFPLPEAQLDRFMMKISMGYPKIEEEIGMLKGQNDAHPIHSLQPVESEERVKYARDSVPKVKIADPVYQYAVKLVASTRKSKDLKLGASPRATAALMRAAQAAALMEGQAYVQPSHVYHLARIVLAHRLVPTAEARLAGKSAEAILDGLLKELPVPVQ